jgi:hypothetical protein
VARENFLSGPQNYYENSPTILSRRWVDSIKMDLREIGLSDVEWIDLALDMDQWKAIVNTVMELRIP